MKSQRFLSTHGVVNNHFQQQRHLMSAKSYRTLRDRSMREWREVTCAQKAGLDA